MKCLIFDDVLPFRAFNGLRYQYMCSGNQTDMQCNGKRQRSYPPNTVFGYRVIHNITKDNYYDLYLTSCVKNKNGECILFDDYNRIKINPKTGEKNEIEK